MKTVEKMARADAEFAGRDYDALGRADKRRFIERAALMLKAAREPTEAMIDAGVTADTGKTLGDRVANCHRAMIDAAVAEAAPSWRGGE